MFRKRTVPFFAALIVALSFALAVTALFINTSFHDEPEISVNSVSLMRYKAPATFENSYATKKLKDEAAASVEPIFVRDKDVTASIVFELEDFFDKIERFKESRNETEYEDFEVEPTPDFSLNTGLLVFFHQEQIERIADMDRDNFLELRAKTLEITEAVLDNGIREDNLSRSITVAKNEVNLLGWDTLRINTAFTLFTNSLKPNLFIDADATNRKIDEKIAAVEPIRYLQGQTIVGEGEIIDEEIYEALETAGFVSQNLSKSLVPFYGGIIYIALIFALMLIYVAWFHKTSFDTRKEIAMFFTIFAMSLIISQFTANLSVYLVPVIFFSMLVSILIDTKLSVVMNLCFSLLCAVIHSLDGSEILFFLVLGTAFALLASLVKERNRIVIVGIVGLLANIALVFASALVFQKNIWPVGMPDVLIYSVLGSIAMLLLCVGSLPFWEGVFGVVTSIKLLDLANPTHALLRRMIIEAPGTYHHSLIVANLAETAAYDIDANSALARVGGYYHDIGKLKHPHYFAENQAGDNPHDRMETYESVSIITAHVKEGVELAVKYRLPRQVVELIEQHHGNTLIQFFYQKELARSEGKASVKESDFRYAYPRPNSKEAAIVMLADTVEAAVRSMSPTVKASEEIELFVRKLIKDKLDDNQLNESNLTLTDIDRIVKAFMTVFRGMYHARIPYPEKTPGLVKTGGGK